MSRATELSQRAYHVARWIVENNATIRQAAKEFGISKSTVHKDVTERILSEDRELYYKVRRVINFNISQRTIRGGEATKRKYKK